MFSNPFKQQLPSKDQSLPGRANELQVVNRHYVLNRPIKPPFPEGHQSIVFGMGCFWGAERRFWGVEGVYTTAVGYTGGYTPNPSYEEVCSGRTGHNEVVLVVYYPSETDLEQLLAVFWQSHNPTQGMRQGNDRGTQYRSGVYVPEQNLISVVQNSLIIYQACLLNQGIKDQITTEIMTLDAFYYAEDYHQQYLAKNPGGYCGLGGCGVDYVNV